MLGKFFQQVEMPGGKVRAQVVDDGGVIDGVVDVVAGAGTDGRGADLQRDLQRLRDGLLAGINPD